MFRLPKRSAWPRLRVRNVHFYSTLPKGLMPPLPRPPQNGPPLCTSVLRQYGNGASSSLSLPPSWTTTVSATTGASEGAIVAMGARGVASARIDGWASVSLWRAATCAGGAVADAGCGLICSSEPPSAGFGPRLAFLLPTGRPGFLGAARAGTV